MGRQRACGASRAGGARETAQCDSGLAQTGAALVRAGVEGAALLQVREFTLAGVSWVKNGPWVDRFESLLQTRWIAAQACPWRI